MSDLIVPDAPEQPVGPEPQPYQEPTPTEPAPASEPPATSTDEVPFESLPKYWQEEISRKRDSEAQYRMRAKQYDEAFEGYDDDTRDAFLQFARLQNLAAQGDPDAIQMLEEFYADDAPEEDPDPEDAPLTRAQAEELARQLAREEAERLYAERDRHQTEQRMVSEVRSTAEGMGYAFGTPEYKMLLTFANEPDVISSDDPLSEAHRRMQAWQQSLIAGHTGQKAAQADTNLAAPATGGGAAPDLSTLPWNDSMSEAQKHAAVRASMAARYEAQNRG